MNVYRHIAETIKTTWILKAQPGERLPTERALESHFGVSRATISRALSVLAAEGWITTRRGSGAYVAKRQADTSSDFRLIGFIAPHISPKDELQNPVLQRIGFGVERRASELGYQAISASSQFSMEHEAKLIDQFIQMGVSGIVLYPTYSPQPRRRDRTDPLAQCWRDYPIVLTDIGSAQWGRSMVQIDNFRLGHDLTAALLRNGHRHIAFLHRDETRLHNSVTDRQRGWEAALLRAGITIPPSYHGWPYADFARREGLDDSHADAFVDALLQLTPRPDAVIAWDDPTAIALIRALQRRGTSLTSEIRVAGFDNYEAGRFFDPPFPTTAPDFIRMGETAVELLDEQLTSPQAAPRTLLLSATIQPRGLLT